MSGEQRGETGNPPRPFGLRPKAAPAALRSLSVVPATACASRLAVIGFGTATRLAATIEMSSTHWLDSTVAGRMCGRLRRRRSRKAHMILANAHENQPLAASWKQAQAAAISDPAELIALLELDPSLLPAARAAAEMFPLRVPRGFVARMRKGDPNDPLL